MNKGIKIIDVERWPWARVDEATGRQYETRSIYRVRVPAYVSKVSDEQLSIFLRLLAIAFQTSETEEICVKAFLPGQNPDGLVFATLGWEGEVKRVTDQVFNMVDVDRSYN